MSRSARACLPRMVESSADLRAVASARSLPSVESARPEGGGVAENFEVGLGHPGGVGGEAGAVLAVVDEDVAVIADAEAGGGGAEPAVEVFARAEGFVELELLEDGGAWRGRRRRRGSGG